MPRKGLIIVISGPSGVGKTTLYKQLRKYLPNLVFSVSVTTRKPREREKNGKDYFFVSRAEFRKMIKENKFLEWAVVHDNYYGTPKEFVDRTAAEGKDIILDIDVQGAVQVKKIYKGDIVLVFILPPSMKTLKDRLRGRAEDSESAIKLRLKNAKKELKYLVDYEYLVINDEVLSAVKKIESIIKAEHRKSNR